MASGFAEFIAENFESMASLTWDLADGRVLAYFSVEDVRVQVQFEERSPGEWTVSFELLTALPSVYLAFHVFNGVFQAVEEFVSVRNPDRVVFVSKRDDMAHIYETYLRRERSRIEQLGYSLSEVQKVPPFREYILQRMKPSQWNLV